MTTTQLALGVEFTGKVGPSLRNALARIRKELKDLSEQYKLVNKAMRGEDLGSGITKSVKTTEEAVKRFKTTFALLKSESIQTGKAYSTLVKRVEEGRTTYSRASAMMRLVVKAQREMGQSSKWTSNLIKQLAEDEKKTQEAATQAAINANKAKTAAVKASSEAQRKELELLKSKYAEDTKQRIALMREVSQAKLKQTKANTAAEIAADKRRAASAAKDAATSKRIKAVADQRIADTNRFKESFLRLGNSSDKFKKRYKLLLDLVQNGSITYNKAANTMKRVEAAQKRAAQAADQAAKAQTRLQVALGKLKNSFASVASFGIASVVIFKITQILREGALAIIDYDQALKDLQAISMESSGTVAQMGEAIKDVAATTKFSATEVANGIRLLAQAGLSSEEAIGAIGATANLATGTLAEMSDATDLVSTTYRAFSEQMKSSGKSVTVFSSTITDIMANAVNRSKLSVDKLRTAFNYVGASASKAGLTIEDTATSMSLLANKGLRASTIGTGLRQVLSKMLAPTTKIKDALHEAGMVIDDINPSAVGFEQALRNLAPILNDHTGKVVDMSKAYSLFQLRGAQAISTLVDAVNGGDYKKMIDQISLSGTAAEMAGIQAEGLGVKIKNLSDKVNLAFVALGESGLTKTFGVIIDGLKALAEWFERVAASPITQFILQFMAVIGTMAAGVAAVGGLVFALKSLVGILGAAGIAITAAGGWIAVGLVGAVSLAVTTYKYLNNAIERNINLLNKQIGQGKALTASIEIAKAQLKDIFDKYEKTGEAAGKYQSVILQLISSHPELAGKVDATSKSYTELLTSLNAINKMAESDVFSAQAKKLELLADSIKDSKDKLGDLQDKIKFFKDEQKKVSGEDKTFFNLNQLKVIENQLNSLYSEKTKLLKTITGATKNYEEELAKTASTVKKRALDEQSALKIDETKNNLEQRVEALKKFADAENKAIQNQVEFGIISQRAADIIKMGINEELRDVAKGLNVLANGSGKDLKKYGDSFSLLSVDIAKQFRKMFNELGAMGDVYAQEQIKQLAKSYIDVVANNNNLVEADRATNAEILKQKKEYLANAKAILEKKANQEKAFRDQLEAADKVSYYNMQVAAVKHQDDLRKNIEKMPEAIRLSSDETNKYLLASYNNDVKNWKLAWVEKKQKASTEIDKIKNDYQELIEKVGQKVNLGTKETKDADVEIKKLNLEKNEAILKAEEALTNKLLKLIGLPIEFGEKASKAQLRYAREVSNSKAELYAAETKLNKINMEEEVKVAGERAKQEVLIEERKVADIKRINAENAGTNPIKLAKNKTEDSRLDNDLAQKKIAIERNLQAKLIVIRAKGNTDKQKELDDQIIKFQIIGEQEKLTTNLVHMEKIRALDKEKEKIKELIAERTYAANKQIEELRVLARAKIANLTQTTYDDPSKKKDVAKQIVIIDNDLASKITRIEAVKQDAIDKISLKGIENVRINSAKIVEINKERKNKLIAIAESTYDKISKLESDPTASAKAATEIKKLKKEFANSQIRLEKARANEEKAINKQSLKDIQSDYKVYNALAKSNREKELSEIDDNLRNKYINSSQAAKDIYDVNEKYNEEFKEKNDKRFKDEQQFVKNDVNATKKSLENKYKADKTYTQNKVANAKSAYSKIKGQYEQETTDLKTELNYRLSEITLSVAKGNTTEAAGLEQKKELMKQYYADLRNLMDAQSLDNDIYNANDLEAHREFVEGKKQVDTEYFNWLAGQEASSSTPGESNGFVNGKRPGKLPGTTEEISVSGKGFNIDVSSVTDSIDSATDGIDDAFDNLIDTASNNMDALEESFHIPGMLMKSIKEISELITDFAKDAKSGNLSIDQLKDRSGDLTGLVDDLKDSLGDLKDVAKDVKDAMADVDAKLSDIGTSFGEMFSNINKTLGDDVDDFNLSWSRMEDILKDAETSMDGVLSLDAIDKQLKDGIITSEEAADAIEDYGAALMRSVDFYEEVGKSAVQLAEDLEDVKDDIAKINDDIAKVNTELTKDIEKEGIDLAKDIKKIKKDSADDLIALEEDLADSIIEVGKDLAKEKLEIEKDLQKNLLDVNKTTADKIRDLERGLLDDIGKYNDDRLRIEELSKKGDEQLAEGKADLALESYNEAQDLASGLAGEIKDDQNNVVVTLADSTSEAMKLVAELGEQIKVATKQSSSEQIATLEDESKESIKLLQKEFEKASEVLSTTTAKAITEAETQATDAIAELERVANESIVELEAERAKIEEIYNKMINMLGENAEVAIGIVSDAQTSAEELLTDYYGDLEKQWNGINDIISATEIKINSVSKTLQTAISNINKLSSAANNSGGVSTVATGGTTSADSSGAQSAASQLELSFWQQLQAKMTGDTGAGNAFIGGDVPTRSNEAVWALFNEQYHKALQKLYNSSGVPAPNPLPDLPLYSAPESFLRAKTGGQVPGTGSGDIVPIMGEPKEFIEPKNIVKKHGVPFFEMLRRNLIPAELTDAIMGKVKGFMDGGVLGSIVPRGLPASTGVSQTGYKSKVNNGQDNLFPTANEKVELVFNINKKKIAGSFGKSAAQELVQQLRMASLTSSTSF